LSDNTGQQVRIEGTVAPGFESVRTVYEDRIRTMAEENAQLCVYHRGEKVVDLWSSNHRDERFSADSIVNVFSSGKSLEAIALAWLVGKGLLDYDKKVADYWPEFGANGKAELTIADWMRHEGGLAALQSSIDPEHLLAENIKKNLVGKVIEDHAPKFPTGGRGRREYHAVSRGWIANEIFRRVDPAGRTIGEFFRQDISGPLEADAIIGVHEPELDRVSKVKPLGFGFHFLESLKPKALGRRVQHNLLQLLGRILKLLPSLRHATTRGAPPPYKGMDGIGFFNRKAVAMGETPSAASNCSARGLAKIAAMMSSRGKWQGVEYVTEDGWNALHAEPILSDMGFTGSNFTQGGVNFFVETNASHSSVERAFNQGREGFYGWMGLGGSIFQWHPEHEIGFGFVPTSLHVLDVLNERGKIFQTEVLRCVERLNR